MIRHLRWKLVAVSMVSLTLVLAVFLVIAAVVRYNAVLSDADQVLEILAVNDGKFPDNFGKEGALKRNISPSDGTDPADGEPPVPPEGQFRPENAPSGLRRGGGTIRQFSPELPYESRFFSVLLTEDGELVKVDTGMIAAVDSETAVAYAQQVYRNGRNGFTGQYRYTIRERNGEVLVVFLDCANPLESFREGQLSALGAAAGGILAIFVLITVFSARIVRPIAESYEKQKRFITDAGHEIKTPLAIISADAEVLQMDLPDNEWLTDIQAQTARLSELTKHLIFLSRMEEETPQVTMIEFPFSDTVSEAARSFQSLARTAGKSFTAAIEPDLTITGDEKSLRELVNILLDNAIKYSAGDGDIRLGLSAQGKNARLTVTNLTEGLTEESVSHLFERFYRADQSRNSSTGGSGIGLSVAQAVATAHKGKITAELSDERRLTITVVLPGCTTAMEMAKKEKKEAEE